MKPKIPELPEGWILKKYSKDKTNRISYVFWGDRKSNKDFTILVVDGWKRFGVIKQHSTFFGNQRVLGDFKTEKQALSRAFKYMGRHIS